MKGMLVVVALFADGVQPRDEIVTPDRQGPTSWAFAAPSGRP